MSDALLDVDPFGIPALPEAIDVSGEKFAERQVKGRVADKIRDNIWARDDLTDDEKDIFTYQAYINDEDTFFLLKAGILPKIMREFEEGDPICDDTKLSEGFRVGVHWSTDQYTHRVYPALYGFQLIDGEVYGFESTISKFNRYQFTPEELEALVILADAKEYS